MPGNFAGLASRIGSVLSNQQTAGVGLDLLDALTGHFSSTNTMQQSVNALLMQIEMNPSNAGQIAAQIAAVPNVPPAVLGVVNEIPAVAGDKVGLASLIAQAEAALNSATSPNTLGRFFGRLRG